MKNLKTILSYVLVAVIASMVTLSVFCDTPEAEYNKLDELTGLIDTYFIEEANHADMEDAAAVAMVDSLGDQWSYYMT
ncbi:MAG: hypothetical protein II983_00575, partial [Firmicutes bacterium]|nr:hypothetical protein [Bacillota bacterium]